MQNLVGDKLEIDMHDSHFQHAVPADDSHFDAEVFVSELTRYQGHLRSFIYASIGDYSHASDILQQTNLALWRKASHYDPERPFLSWAYGVARFEILKFLRHHSRDPLLFEPELIEAMGKVAEQHSEDFESRHQAMLRCIEALPSNRRWLLQLRYTHGHNMEEIAAISKRSVASVKTLMMRLRRSLRECIEKRVARES